MLKLFLFRVLRGPLTLGLLTLALTAGATNPAPAVLVVGDSISAAYGMSLDQGWVALLERRLADERPGSRVVNASISGETSAGGLRRLPALLEEHHPTLVIIELGGNDGLRGYPINKFRDNLKTMATLSQAAGAQVLFLAMEIPPNYGSRYTTAFRDSFAVAARETGSELGPFLLDGVAAVPGMMQADGIHPTVAAQQRLLDNVYPSLQGMLTP